MKKKIFSIVMAAMLICSMALTGCGAKAAEAAVEEAVAEAAVEAVAEEAYEEGAADAAEAVAEAADHQLVIGFANASVSNSWRVKMRDMLMEAAEKLGVKIIETDAHDDANTQNSNIETMLMQDMDAILITPAVEDAINPSIEEAYATGMPVILFDRTASTEDYTHFVGWTDENNGAACAQMMVDALTAKYGEPKGKILALDSIAGSGTDNGQKAGQEKIFSQYPNIEIVDRAYTDFEESQGKAAMENWLQKYKPGDVDGFISQDGCVTLAAWQAIEEAGRQDEGLIIVNADGVNGVCRLIKEGKAYGLTQFPCAASVAALELAIQTLEGTDPAEKIVVKEPVVVTAENVDDYYIPDGDDYDWTY